MRRIWLLFLRLFWQWRERRHIYLTAVAEERRRCVLRRLRLLDAPVPHKPQRFRWLVRMLWERQ